MSGDLILAQPGWLALLPLPWLVARLARRQRQARLARLLAPILWPLLIRPMPAGPARTLGPLFMTAWTLAVLAVSAPQHIQGDVEAAPRGGLDIALVVDISPSMDAADVVPSRLARARFELQDALPRLQGHRLALVVFSAEAYRLLPLTTDTTTVAYFISSLDSGLTRRHGSNLTMALESAARLLEDSPHDGRAILLLSDGECRDPASVLAAAQRLGRKDLPVFALGIGTLGGAPVPDEHGRFLRQGGKTVISRLNAPLLRRLARLSGGSYTPLRDDDSDWTVLERALARLTPHLREAGTRHPRARHLYPWPLAASLVLFLLPGLGLGPIRGLHWPRPAAVLLPCLLLLPAAPLQASPWLALQARQALEQGDYARAEQLYESLGGFRGALGKGAAAYRQGRWARALRAFEAARHRAGDEAQQALAAYDLGTTLLRLGRLDAAERALRDALRLRPDHRDAARNLRLLQEARRRLGAGGARAGHRPADTPASAGADPLRAAGEEPGQGQNGAPKRHGHGMARLPRPAEMAAARAMVRMRMESQEAAFEALAEDRPW